ncbi:MULTISPECIES: hypothetical protein [Edwardsiella]|uniref:Uncharacterized protein n=2 Tax=Edwardsiella anguillarum TaxID=1821960 RepID=A0A076LGN7_9GAMM|nr:MULTISPECIES: hypothetical protein [Edwardsiella]GAJ67413.1 nitroreductase family protein with 4Fe-4S ferredoxin iron-sulfur binding domain [Edwardsiella piscicida]AIJ07266.1 Hypothetical protein ETEE_0795 [Edwardsiella anguillarum ET080813]MDA6077044.1 hypothetical protein [Edwardsiella anguillarum]UBU94690.1 hypothetical protein AAZ33_19545 [Edwardsiella sp. LADL05-105]UOU78371.1 hypothetical protein MUN71_15195 [Edwardsiella anguillarum]
MAARFTVRGATARQEGALIVEAWGMGLPSSGYIIAVAQDDEIALLF